MDKKYSIELVDGTKFFNLVLFGKVYLSETEINKESFTKRNCSSVKISDEENVIFCGQMELLDITKDDDKWRITLIKISNEEIMFKKLRSDIDYLSMMVDVNL